MKAFAPHQWQHILFVFHGERLIFMPRGKRGGRNVRQGGNLKECSFPTSSESLRQRRAVVKRRRENGISRTLKDWDRLFP